MPTKKETTQSTSIKKAPAKKADAKKISEAPVAAKAVEEKKTADLSPQPLPPKAAKEPEKQAAPKPVAEKKPAAKPATTTKASTKKVIASVTRIIAKVDIGYGNVLYLRGEGGGLSWDKGAPMENSGGDQWSWSTKSTSKEIVFKFLINDQTWSSGENAKVEQGDTSISTPMF